MRAVVVTAAPPSEFELLRSAWVGMLDKFVSSIGDEVSLFIWCAPNQDPALPKCLLPDNVTIYEKSDLWHVDVIKQAIAHYSTELQWRYLLDLQAIGLLNDAVLVSEQLSQSAIGEQFIWLSPSMFCEPLFAISVDVRELAAAKAQWISVWDEAEHGDRPRSTRAPTLIAAAPALINRVNAAYWYQFDCAVRAGNLPNLPEIYREIAANMPALIAWTGVNSAHKNAPVSQGRPLLSQYKVYG